MSARPTVCYKQLCVGARKIHCYSCIVEYIICGTHIFVNLAIRMTMAVTINKEITLQTVF